MDPFKLSPLNSDDATGRICGVDISTDHTLPAGIRSDMFADGLSVLPELGRPGRLDVVFGLEPIKLADDPLPSPTIAVEATSALERAVVLLAEGRDEDALNAASEACHLRPDLPQPHFVYGQAWARLGRPQNAEPAFATAIQLAPDWADAWVNYGVARYHRDALDDAITATREALHRVPNHPAATVNLKAFLQLRNTARTDGAARQAAPTNKTNIKILNVADPARAMGLAVGYLMDKEAFAKLPFQHWAHVLNGQIKRSHFRIFVDGNEGVRGFFGWSLATEAAAEAWLTGKRSLTFDECLEGDCVIFNVWAADTFNIHRFMVNESRSLFAGKRVGFYKRYYSNGRVRLARLPGTAFVQNHIERANAAGRDS